MHFFFKCKTMTIIDKTHVMLLEGTQKKQHKNLSKTIKSNNIMQHKSYLCAIKNDNLQSTRTSQIIIVLFFFLTD